MKNKSLPYLLFMALSLSGCSAIMPTSVTNVVIDDFGSSEVYSRAFPGSSKVTCEASRRALLSQGYIIEDDSSTVKAHKNFQPTNETHIQVRFTVTCADNNKGSHASTVFVNAVKDRYSLRKSSNSASVGIPAVSFSLPLTSTDEAMVKVASETVSSKKFYNHFFDTVERFIEIEESEITPEKNTPTLATVEQPPVKDEPEVPLEETTDPEQETKKIEIEELLQEKKNDADAASEEDPHPPRMAQERETVCHGRIQYKTFSLSHSTTPLRSYPHEGVRFISYSCIR